MATVRIQRALGLKRLASVLTVSNENGDYNFAAILSAEISTALASRSQTRRVEIHFVVTISPV